MSFPFLHIQGNPIRSPLSLWIRICVLPEEYHDGRGKGMEPDRARISAHGE